jgi:hypothetical protein
VSNEGVVRLRGVALDGRQQAITGALARGIEGAIGVLDELDVSLVPMRAARQG